MSLPTKEKKAAYMKEWRAANKEKVKSNFQKWNKENRESRAAYMKDYLANYAATERVQLATWERNLRRNYRLTPDQFNDMWESQGGKCGICQIQMAPKGRSKEAVSVDHNHQTGEVRGLLCGACNRGIGNLRDCPDILEAAAKYLRQKGNYSKSALFKDK